MQGREETVLSQTIQERKPEEHTLILEIVDTNEMMDMDG